MSLLHAVYPPPPSATVGALCRVQYTTQPATIQSVFSPKVHTSASHTTFGSKARQLASPVTPFVTIAGEAERRSPVSAHPIVLLGRSFEVRELDGARVVLRKGRKKHCWHVARGRVIEWVLAGLDVAAVRS